ncbi:hypothetical protein A9Q86_10590 [Flavobacteriales bacterium 33_180_T64]|nr:hypothetical protein A9Q86_10590 [Flavobacteriales bacterium 33_180_T64]
MEETMHIAAQYLATSAISFITKEDDDSHTNLGWINRTLETHPFINGDKLGLNYEHFSLEWIHSDGNKEHLFLNNVTHKEVIDWIALMSIDNHIEKVYSYLMHYDLPYKKISDTFRFKLTSQNDLNQLIKKRDLAQHVISKVLTSNNYISPIRIWPHHFDTGAFVNINKKLSIGIGMAIPDSLIDDFYFYISGYNNHKPINLELPKNINKETYYTNGWQGFAIPISESDEDSIIDFCQVAINLYLNSINDA